jgi:hypothetical protein
LSSYHGGEILRERAKAAVCGILLVRINLAWAGGANSWVPPRDSFKMMKEKNGEKGQLPSTDFHQLLPCCQYR